ncbi:hypothetical protein K504DRAFT_178394 [Pleomassaria siparia CBS 279.74]|uniref:Uncharacterized protein n=1 Tax=Pleomassaria siparia CBS 279.74 TaxID=1314801 RepID=A0A6G1JSH0_9PLEO|nr:hypothetical protein K504DRAFT_178394 [Pleomassaria siparia CBS 279.74]
MRFDPTNLRTCKMAERSPVHGDCANVCRGEPDAELMTIWGGVLKTTAFDKDRTRRQDKAQYSSAVKDHAVLLARPNGTKIVMNAQRLCPLYDVSPSSPRFPSGCGCWSILTYTSIRSRHRYFKWAPDAPRVSHAEVYRGSINATKIHTFSHPFLSLSCKQWRHEPGYRE